MNRLYPVFCKLEGRKCLVVGGGEVAERKIAALLECMACVTAVSLDFNSNILGINNKNLTLFTRSFEEKDVDGTALVIAATDDGKVNEAVWRVASSRGIPVNVVDRPDLCSFFVPSVLTKGDLKIAISTAGRAPRAAKKIRQDIEAFIGDRYDALIDALATVRRALSEKYSHDASAGPSGDELLKETKKWI